MIKIGDSKLFSLEFMEIEGKVGQVKISLDDLDISYYSYKDNNFHSKCNIQELLTWFNKNYDKIIHETVFPLDVDTDSSIDFYELSGDFDSDDDNIFDQWYDKRQAWYFAHSWYIARDSYYLPEVYFKRSGEFIQIEWDNTKLYDGVKFFVPKGKISISIDYFKNFIITLNNQISEYGKNNF